jgi:acyl transferase domain-containing protein
MSLRALECDTAIAAGVNLILTPHSYIGMSQAGMLSPDGKCYAFDRRANGMVPGEAVVAIVFKRFSQAQRDGDMIYATIRGSGINYDGKTNGLTAPRRQNSSMTCMPVRTCSPRTLSTSLRMELGRA